MENQRREHGMNESIGSQDQAQPAPAPAQDTGRSAQIDKLAAALAAAQGAFPPIPKDREVTVRMKSGGSYKFAYAPLDTIFAAVRKPLSDNGFALTQDIIRSGGRDEVRTTLLHTSGQYVSNRVTVFGGGAGDAQAQSYGSGLTYARRYGVTLLLGVVADEDDDGNGASEHERETRDRGATRPAAPAPVAPAPAAPRSAAPAPAAPRAAAPVPGSAAHLNDEAVKEKIRKEVREIACKRLGFSGEDLIAGINRKFGRRFLELSLEECETYVAELIRIAAQWPNWLARFAAAFWENPPEDETFAAHAALNHIKTKMAPSHPLAASFDDWQRWIDSIQA